jgi:hypothetical protein
MADGGALVSVPDIAGVYETSHPRNSLGSVLVQFCAGTDVLYDGQRFPGYDVSVWEQAEAPRKYRDGTFGTFTRAFVYNFAGGLALGWQSPSEDLTVFNAIVGITDSGNLLLGGEDICPGHSSVEAVLVRTTCELPRLLNPREVELPGVYSYFHSATGHVLVRFSEIHEHIRTRAGNDVPLLAVEIVAEAGDLGYCHVRDGLYGGSFEDDTFTRAAVETRPDGTYILWFNPENPGLTRCNRIVSASESGDIAMGLAEGELSLVADTRFLRVGGPDSRVDTMHGFLSPGGTYEVAIGDSESTVEVILGTPSPTVAALFPDDNWFSCTGLFAGDPFTHVCIRTLAGRGYLTWYSPQDQVIEQNLILSMEDDGSFLAVGGEFGARYRVVSFARTESSSLTGEAPATPVPGLAAAERSRIAHTASIDYSELPPAFQKEWEMFSGWSHRPLSSPERSNHNPEGFAGDPPATPANEFAAFAAECFLPIAYRDPMHRLEYRFPDRYRWFRSVFGEPTRRIPEALHTSSLFTARPDNWIDSEQVQQVELVITTPTNSAPESLAGHLLLLVKQFGDHPDGSDSLVLGFVGVTSLDTGNGVDGLTYVWRGLTGHYESAIQEERFEHVVARARVLEDRDVYRYVLNLSDDETARLIERLWTMRHSFTYSYRFFGMNCASMLLDALNFAFGPDNVIDLDVPAIAPLHVVAALNDAGRLGPPVQPTHRSIRSTALRADSEMQELQERILTNLADLAGREDCDPEVLVRATELFREIGREGQVLVSPDPLFREPVVRTVSTRSTAYLELGRLCAECIPVAGMLLEYYALAWHRELYLALPRRTVSSRGMENAIPADLPADFVERELQRVQLRQENSPEIIALREATSHLRLSLAGTDSHAGSSFLVARTIQEAWRSEDQSSAEAAAESHGYYPVDIEVGFEVRPDAIGASLAVAGAVFREEMGHGSLFTLKRDMAMTVLEAGVRTTVTGTEPRFEAGTVALSLHGTLFHFQKVLPDRRLCTAGHLDHGFGFTILDGGANLLVELARAQPLPAEVSMSVRPLELRYVLNLFHTPEFMQFVNLDAGAAWLVTWSGGQPDSLLGLPFVVEAGLHPCTTLDRCLRIHTGYEVSLSPVTSPAHRFWSRARWEWSPRRRPHAIAALEMGMEFAAGGARTFTGWCNFTVRP